FAYFCNVLSSNGGCRIAPTAALVGRYSCYFRIGKLLGKAGHYTEIRSRIVTLQDNFYKQCRIFIVHNLASRQWRKCAGNALSCRLVASSTRGIVNLFAVGSSKGLFSVGIGSLVSG